MRIIFCYFFYLSIAFSTFATAVEQKYDLGMFDFNARFVDGYDEPDDTRFSVFEMIERTLKNGPAARQELQNFYQSKENVKVQRGNIFPQLNSLDALDTIMTPSFAFDIHNPAYRCCVP